MNPLMSFMTKKYGESGPPKGILPEFEKTWNLFESQLGLNSTRVENLLNFFHFVATARLKAFSGNIRYGDLYKNLVVSELEPIAKIANEKLVKSRIFQAFKVVSTKIHTSRTPKSDVLKISFLMKMRNKGDKFNQAVDRTRGSLFQGNVPPALQERWTSNGRVTKSLLRTPEDLIRDDAVLDVYVGRYPFYVTKPLTIYAVASKDSTLVLTLVISLTPIKVDFIDDKKWKKFIVTELKKQFKLLK